MTRRRLRSHFCSATLLGACFGVPASGARRLRTPDTRDAVVALARLIAVCPPHRHVGRFSAMPSASLCDSEASVRELPCDVLCVQTRHGVVPPLQWLPGPIGVCITPMGNTLRAPATPVNNVLTFTMIGPSKAAPRVEMGSIGAVSRRRCVAALPRACNPLASV